MIVNLNDYKIVKQETVGTITTVLLDVSELTDEIGLFGGNIKQDFIKIGDTEYRVLKHGSTLYTRTNTVEDNTLKSIDTTTDKFYELELTTVLKPSRTIVFSVTMDVSRISRVRAQEQVSRRMSDLQTALKLSTNKEEIEVILVPVLFKDCEFQKDEIKLIFDSSNETEVNDVKQLIETFWQNIKNEVDKESENLY